MAKNIHKLLPKCELKSLLKPTLAMVDLKGRGLFLSFKWKLQANPKISHNQKKFLSASVVPLFHLNLMNFTECQSQGLVCPREHRTERLTTHIITSLVSRRVKELGYLGYTREILNPGGARRFQRT